MNGNERVKANIQDYLSHGLAGSVIGLAVWASCLIIIYNFPMHSQGDDAPEYMIILSRKITVTKQLLNQGIVFPVIFSCIGFCIARFLPLCKLRSKPIAILLQALFVVLILICRYIKDRIYVGWPFS